MFTRKLALSVATAALLAASALPAMAIPADINDVRFFFDGYLPSTITGIGSGSTDPLNRIQGYFTTDNSALNGTGTFTGFRGTIGTSNIDSNLNQPNPPNLPLSTANGSWLTRTSTGIAQANSGFEFTINTSGLTAFTNTPYTLTLLGYSPSGSQSSILGRFLSENANGDLATINATLRPLLMPEINANALPKGLFVIGGVFLMLFGRNRLNEA